MLSLCYIVDIKRI